MSSSLPTNDGPPVGRVLMTADPIGGVFTYAVDLVEGLAERGVETTLAVMGRLPSPAQRRRVDAIAGVTLQARAYALEWMDHPWDDIAEAADWLLDLAGRYQPDLIHLNTTAHGGLAWDAPVVTVGHSCVLSWMDAVHGGSHVDARPHYRRVVQQSLAASDVVVAPSSTMLAALQRHYGPLGSTQIIYNGRRARDWPPGGRGTVQPPDAQSPPAVLTVGRLWDEAKNVAAVVQAAPAIAGPVYVAGSLAHPDGGAVELNSPDGADLQALGQLDPDALADWYGHCQIYALPARYEPFGLTVLEAALAGNALVVGDIESLREIWGSAALFVDPDRPDALAEAVNALIDDDQLRDQMARRARRRALQLSVSAMVDGYVDLYRHMAVGPAAEAPADLRPSDPTQSGGPGR